MKSFFVLEAVIASLLLAQKPSRPGFHQSVHVGKVASVRSERLTRFHEPRPIPPHVRPPEREGGAWRWHRHYGWINLPVGVAPQNILLPETFVLPQTVTTYEIPQVEASITVICPHCGLPVVVQLPK